MNENGCWLAEFCALNNLVIGGTLLKEKKGRALTQSYEKGPIPTDMSKAQSDNTKNRHQKVRLHSDCGPT